MFFPFGKAPLALLGIAAVTGAVLLWERQDQRRPRYDLVFALFARTHYDAYVKAVPKFERERGVRVLLELVPARGLQNRLQSAFLAGAPVPDVVEIVNGSMGYFTKGPLKDVGFVDLTERLHKEGIYDRIVKSRFSLWSSRGHIFALPHDVHPVMLVYRRDLIEQEGLDVKRLDTWDQFVAAGRRVTRDLDGDGTPDRYMLDLQDSGGYLELLLGQRGGGLFNARGEVIFDNNLGVETTLWYARQTRGPKRIATDCGWGQTLNKAVLEGLALFFICPDWRSKFFERDLPQLKGKMALMPLPAWTPGGRRTATWGGTGICITKACKRQDLAWEFVKFLYLEKDELGKRFLGTNIIPPVKDAWDLPVFHQPNAFFSNQPLGALYAALAPQTPPAYVTAYSTLARTKLQEAFLNVALRYEKRGDAGLRAYARSELKRCADYVRYVMSRNRFLRPAPAKEARRAG